MAAQTRGAVPGAERTWLAQTRDGLLGPPTVSFVISSESLARPRCLNSALVIAFSGAGPPESSRPPGLDKLCQGTLLLLLTPTAFAAACAGRWAAGSLARWQQGLVSSTGAGTGWANPATPPPLPVEAQSCIRRSSVTAEGPGRGIRGRA